MKIIKILFVLILFKIFYSCSGDSFNSLFGDIEDNSLRIIRPNGEEVWEEGTIQKIKFSGGKEENYGTWYDYTLYYSVNNSDWIKIGDGWSDIGESERDWEIPIFYNTLTNCRIKISQREIEDISDGYFTIQAKEQSDLFTIVQPNGGEIFNEQTNQEVVWYTTGDIGSENLILKYTLNGGLKWYDINGTHPNDGSYTWTLPNITDKADYCLFGIWNIPQSGSSENLYRISDNFFSIVPDSNYYMIIQPNGGEVLDSGTEYQIQWSSNGDVGSINIYYSTFNGESWYQIAEGITGGTYMWSVPYIQGTIDICKVKIQSRDRESWFDISDNNFTIRN